MKSEHISPKLVNTISLTPGGSGLGRGIIQQKKLLMLDGNYWLGINPQIPSLDPPLVFL